MAGPVAVIAVHGVADQERDQTAVKVANQLLHLGQVAREGGEKTGPRASYSGFEQEKIRVSVEALDVTGMGDEDAWQYQLRRHLEDYRGEGTKGAYETVRMEGYRLVKDSADAEPKLERPVHVYELHWADASRLPFGILNIFLGIYRLLFETSWLGMQTTGCWASFGKDVGRWSRFTSFRGIMLILQTVCSLILTRFMPLIYLLMIGMLGLMVIPVVESDWAEAALGGLGGYPGLFALAAVLVVAVALIAGAAAAWRRIPWPPMYAVVALISFLVWNLTFAAFQDQTGSWRAEAGVAMASWCVICLLVSFFVLPPIGKRFPGSGLMGWALMGYFTVFLVLGLIQKTEWPLLIAGPMLALRMGFALLPFAWMILATTANLFLILAALDSILLWFRRGLAPEVIRRKRERLRTAVMSIVLPVLLISFLNSTFFLLALIPFKMGLVDGAVPIAERTADAPAWVRPVSEAVEAYVEPLASWASLPGFREWAAATAGENVRFSAFATYASQRMVVPFLEAVFLVVLLVLGYSLWVVAPAAIAERAYRKTSKIRKVDRVTQALGNNLSQGYRWIWAGQVVLAGCLLATQGLFAYRGVRSRESAPQGPVMTLVDQFLGVRHLMDVPEQPVALALADASTAGGAVAPAPAPVAEVSPVPSALPHAGVRRPPSVAPGRALLPERAERFAHVQNRLPVPQQSFEQRQEVRETIEDIFLRRDESTRMKGGGKKPSGRPEAAVPGGGAAAAEAPEEVAAAESAPPPLLIKAVTEAVLFLNSGPLTSAFGALILILAIGYVFFARLMDPVVAGLRGGLDIVLDVLNYLRPRPVEETPRARILSRYASLLRYILDWRDPRNPKVGYSRIVIVAHSQGSVITSDMLRALGMGSVATDNELDMLKERSDSREGIPVRLLTMGSPLQQLYASRFPDLYAWNPSADPRETHRALECWWNVYRSGDYVGRALFRDERDKDRFVPGRDFFLSKDGKNLPVRETCLGPGAHTQYWDESAPTVIRDLDRLIACDRVDDLCHPSPEKAGTGRP